MTRLGCSLWLTTLVTLLVGIAPAGADVTIPWITIGAPGNAADAEVMDDGTTGYGSVPEIYRISKYEVTNAQYAAFLNAVAKADPNGLYSVEMGTSSFGGIARTGSAGSFAYAPIAGRESKPVNFVSFHDAIRFANWLHNGQPDGAQGPATTEDGAYTITAGGLANNAITRNATASYFVPSEDEWYKAAYYHAETDVYANFAITDPTLWAACTTPPAVYGANCGNAVGDVTDVGSYGALSVSAAGSHDQGGNVREWNEAIIDGTDRGLRGGSFASTVPPSDLGAWTRQHDVPATESESIGFRVATHAPPTATFTPLGDLPGGSFDSAANAISADGTTVVGSSGSATGDQAFIWTADQGMQGLAGPSTALDVSADGAAVAGALGGEAFRWTAGEGMVPLGVPFEPDPDETFTSWASGISADGTVVVGTGQRHAQSPFYVSLYRAFAWTPLDGMLDLSSSIPQCTTPCQVTDVSADGTTIVGSQNSLPAGYVREPYLWSETTGLQLLGLLPGEEEGEATAISDDGSTVVGYDFTPGTSPPFYQAFVWSAQAGLVGLGGYESIALGVSGDGSRVVGTFRASQFDSFEAFVWDAAGGLVALEDVLSDRGVDLTGWDLVDATDVSADGQRIVGWGTNPTGDTEAFLVQLPEPSRALLLAPGCLVLLALHRARTRSGGHRTDGAMP